MSIFQLVPSIERLNCKSFIMDEDIAERNNIGWRMERAQPDSNNPVIEPLYPGTTVQRSPTVLF